MSDDAPEWSCGDPDCAACLNRDETERAESVTMGGYPHTVTALEDVCAGTTDFVKVLLAFGAAYKGERVVQAEYSDMGPAPMLSEIDL